MPTRDVWLYIATGRESCFRDCSDTNNWGKESCPEDLYRNNGRSLSCVIPHCYISSLSSVYLVLKITPKSKTTLTTCRITCFTSHVCVRCSNVDFVKKETQNYPADLCLSLLSVKPTSQWRINHCMKSPVLKLLLNIVPEYFTSCCCRVHNDLWLLWARTMTDCFVNFNDPAV